MSLKMSSSPYQRSPRTTLQIMIELSIALLLVWVAAVIYNFTLSSELGVRAILLMVVALVTTAAIDAIVALIKHKKGQNLLNEVIDSVVHNYSFVTAIIFTLCCPVYVTYYVIIIGCLFSTGLKHCFGGFGKNIFNPAIIGRIVTGYFFSSAFIVPSQYVEADLMAGSTVTSQYSALSGVASRWLSNVLPEGYNLGTLLLGNYVGAMGETFTVLILVLGIVLAIRGVINWKSTAFYLGTVALSAFAIGIFTDGLNPFTYVVYHLALGGLMFGAVFMITDPVTSPTSPFGKALIGVIAGLFTVLFRMDSNNPEGVMYSIALVNIIAPLIDRLVAGRTTDGHGKKWATIGALVFSSMLINTAISIGNVKAVENANSSEVEEDSSEENSDSSSSSEVLDQTYEKDLFGIEGAIYNKVTLGALKEGSHINQVYVASVNNVDTAVCYELKVEHTFDTGHGDGKINGTVGISFDLATDKVLTAKAIDLGTAKKYKEAANTVLANFVGIDAATVAAFTATSHDGVDFVSKSTVTSTLALELSVEAAQQYLTDKSGLSFGVEASFEKVENPTLSADTTIKNVYIGKVDGAIKYAAYESAKTTTWNTGHGADTTFEATAYITIDVTTETIANFVISNCGTRNKDLEAGKTVAAAFIGKDVNTVASMTTSSHDGIDFVAKSTKTSEAVLTLVVDASKQYVNVDKASFAFGVSASFEKVENPTLSADTTIKNVYVGKVDGVIKYVGYESAKTTTWNTGHGADTTFEATAYITIDVTTETIVNFVISNCGTRNKDLEAGKTVATAFIGLDVNTVKDFTATSHEGVDFVSKSTKTSEAVLTLVVDASNQFVNTDKNLYGGNE